MLPESNGVRLVRITMVVLALACAGVLLLRSSIANPAAVRVAEQHLATADAEREASAAQTATVVARAAQARAATKPAIARAESLRALPLPVAVPPLVMDRLEADSVAIGALSVALTWDARALAAREEQLLAEAKVRDAARITIAELEGDRRPRCGRRCGMLIGAASVVALGIALR